MLCMRRQPPPGVWAPCIALPCMPASTLQGKGRKRSTHDVYFILKKKRYDGRHVMNRMLAVN